MGKNQNEKYCKIKYSIEIEIAFHKKAYNAGSSEWEGENLSALDVGRSPRLGGQQNRPGRNFERAASQLHFNGGGGRKKKMKYLKRWILCI